MSFFRTNDPLKEGSSIEITDQEAAHALKARRVTRGQQITVTDPNGVQGIGEVTETSTDTLTVHITQIVDTKRLPNTTLAIAVTKKPAMEEIVRHATELGVTHIAFWQSENSPITLEGIPSRLQRVTEEACKQSNRPTPPTLTWHASLDSFKNTQTTAKYIVLDQHRETNAQISAEDDVVLVIGPEGGLTERELSQLDPTFISVGPFTLRSETAALSAAAVVNVLRS